MTKEEQIKEESVQFVKDNKKKIIQKIIKESKVSIVDNPESYFMAGAPGAGKTEFSKKLIKWLKVPCVRIDADEIRAIIPQYNGSNSDLIQSAANIGVEKLHDYVLSKNFNYIMDSTFSNYDKQLDNINRALNKGRAVIIFYIYQDPIIAWEFTKAREKIEGRKVPMDVFIDKYFNSINTANKIKKHFGNDIVLKFIEKNVDNDVKKYKINVDRVDTSIKKKYTKELLDKSLRDVV
jgi:UDP-N-acetylglucosamine kinase